MDKTKGIDSRVPAKPKLRLRLRSRTAKAKSLKREKIKSTTLLLFLKRNELPSVDQIAKKVQMAKGTFYLYFKTREEVYLEILQDMYQGAFGSLAELLRERSPMTVEDFAHIVISYFEKHQEFLTLASLSSTILESNVSYNRLLAFKQMLRGEMVKLAELVSAIRRDLVREQILALMTLTFATVIGVWQQSAFRKSHHRLRNHPECRSLLLDFSESGRLAVAALWRGIKFENIYSPLTRPSCLRRINHSSVPNFSSEFFNLAGVIQNQLRARL